MDWRIPRPWSTSSRPTPPTGTPKTASDALSSKHLDDRQARAVANLRGLPKSQDFILKDRYHNLWAYTCDLKPLWHRALNTGHYPRARDINGDGKDEVLAGYSMLAADGTTMWTVPGGDPDRNRFPGPEHADSVLIERFGLEPDSPIRIAIAASDVGFLLPDKQGHLLAQHRIGHEQSLAVGRFRPDLPGRQFLVRTQWGNQNILHLLDLCPVS